MTRSRIRVFTLSALFCTLQTAQAQTVSTAPKYTTETCGKAVCTWNAFGPQTFTRQTGKPQAITANFSIWNPNTQYTLSVQNSGVASAVITVNGAEIFGPSDFNPNVTILQRPVALQLNNTIAVELRGKPGTSLTITVIGVDRDPPGITYTENPLPNQYGWNNTNVTLGFACSDKTSGIAFCSGPVTLIAEGLGLTASGMAQDRAGNSSTVTVPVNIDKTPPTIVPHVSPAPNAAGWNNTPVTVSFACADALSGVASCTPPIAINNEGANETISGTATDRAGNAASASAVVNLGLRRPSASPFLPMARPWRNLARNLPSP